MDFSLRQMEDRLEIVMCGELTVHHHLKFKSMLKQVGASQPKLLILDFSAVKLIDSCGLGLLLIAKDEMDELKTDIVLRGACGQVKKMLNLSCFDALFSMA